MSVYSKFLKPLFRPAIPLGTPFDIPTGSWMEGMHGETIMNGGLFPMTGISARANNFKSGVAIEMILRTRKSCRLSDFLVYDSEGTLPFVQRFNNQASKDPYLSTLDFNYDEQGYITDISRYTGDEFCMMLRDSVSEKSKGANIKKYTKKTPFIDPRNKEQREAIYPSFALVDSLSKMPLSTIEAMYAKNEIGTSGNNTDAAQAGKAKNQWMNQLPQLLAKNGLYVIMTALVGDTMMEDKYAPDKRRLANMEKGTNYVGTCPSYYSLPNNLYEVRRKKPLLGNDKKPIYPNEYDPDIEGDTDLQIITVFNLRPKNGIAGIPVQLIMSQTVGPLVHLSAFHMCREQDWFGITTSGNNANYRMDLRPDVALTRKNIRAKLEVDPFLTRAVEITNDMLMMKHYHRELWARYGCTAQELYDDLIALGYDWDTLLQTRNYWVFEDEESLHEAPFLSVMDLLKMRKKEYVPYWLSKEEKAKLKL